MTRWVNGPGDGPVVTRRIENLNESERRHLDNMVKRGHIKNEFEKMRREDYTRKHNRGKQDMREKMMSVLPGGALDGVCILNRVDGKWLTPK